MTKSLLLGAVCACVLSLLSMPAHGGLVDNGGGLIYDTVLDITWAQPDVRSVTWEEAKTYAADLTLGGASDWRLPYISVAAGAGPFTGTAVDCSLATETECRDNEFGYMFYQNLGGSFGSPTPPNGDPAALALFPELLSQGYWSGTEYDAASASAWVFEFINGFSNDDIGANFAWAVHAGNVGGTTPTATLLRNTDVTTLEPVTPTLDTIFPLSDDIYLADVTPGVVDPDPDVLGDTGRPLVFYGLDDATAVVLLTKTASGQIQVDW